MNPGEGQLLLIEQVHPLHDGNIGLEDHARDPLQIFPEELWSLIFKRLDCKGLKCCYDTCVAFQNILEKTRMHWLFGCVYPLLQKKLDIKTLGVDLLCRQVCKAWKAVVESNSDRCLIFKFPFRGENDPQLQKLEDMKQSKSPFDGIVRGHVQINHQFTHLDFFEGRWQVRNINGEEYVRDALPFFDDFGQYIRKLTFHVDTAFIKDEHLVTSLLYGLGKCVNLEHLSIIGQRLHTKFNVNPAEVDVLAEGDFAVSSKLTTFEVDRVLGFESVQNRILEHCSGTLKRVKVMEWDADFGMNLEWTCLKELDLHGMKQRKVAEIPTDEHFLSKLAQMRAPNLTNLAVVLLQSEPGAGDEPNADWLLKDLLAVTNNFPKLEHLSLDFWTKKNYYEFYNSDINENLQMKNLANPCLKTLDLPLSPGWSSNCNFLVLFQSVEILKIFVPASQPRTAAVPFEEEIVQVTKHMFQKNMVSQSNVWELMPCLKKINVRYQNGLIENGKIRRYKTFTRNAYDMRN